MTPDSSPDDEAGDGPDDGPDDRPDDAENGISISIGDLGWDTSDEGDRDGPADSGRGGGADDTGPDIDLPDPFERDGSPAPLPTGRTLGIAGGILAILLLGLLWFFRPWLHPLVYGVLFRSPGMLQWLVLALLLGGLGLRYRRLRPILGNLALLLGVVSLVLVFLAPVVGGAYMNVHLSDEVSTSVTELDDLPDTDTDTPRILPSSVAQQYAQNSLQFPRHSIGVGDITFVDGTPHWSYPLKPDGSVNTFVGKQAGAVFVNMSTQGKDVSVTEREFACGQGQQVTDNVVWKLRKSEYAVEYQDPFMLNHGGDLYMAVPYVSHDHQFRLTPIPQVYSIPRFGGIALVDADCDIRHLSPAEARSSEILDGQRFYPYSLARLRVNAMQYQHGIVNKWFTHRDQLELADVPGETNDQPFTVTTGGGITYVVAAEPWGNAAGIYQLWTIDSRTGEMARFKTDVQSAMLGPRKAANFVQQDNPRVNWESMSPSEPLPVVRDGRLYWEVRVVPDSSAGVTYTAFVNADTGDVIRYRGDQRITAFLSGAGRIPGGDGGTTAGSGSVSGGGSGADLVVAIVDENGTVVRTVPVGEDERIRIERNGTGANSTRAGG